MKYFKYIIAFLSFSFLFYLFIDKKNLVCISLSSLRENFCLLILLIVLFFINWSLEALRWKILLSNIQFVSFKKSLISVLIGLTTAIITPAHLGEFLGRLIPLNIQSKKFAVFLWYLGGFILTIAILCLGIPSLFFYERKWLILDVLFGKIGFIAFAVIAFLLIVMLLSFLYFFYYDKIKKHFFTFSISASIKVLILSILRCFVFSFQMFLLLYFYGLDFSFFWTFTGICVSYMIITFIPSFFLSDAAVRSSVNVLILSPFVSSPVIIVSASVSLWILNVAIPTFLGVFLLIFYRKREIASN